MGGEECRRNEKQERRGRNRTGTMGKRGHRNEITKLND